MKPHELKTEKELFQCIVSGEKTFETRLNDRAFQKNDILILYEYDSIESKYSGRYCIYIVSYIIPGGNYGIQNGYVVMSIIPYKS